MREQPLPYWIYLGAGVLISGYATFVIYGTNVKNTAAMQLFFWVGCVFIAVGAIKYFLQRGDNEKPVKTKAGQSNKSIIICPLCGTKNYAASNFCHICGQRLKNGTIQSNQGTPQHTILQGQTRR